MPQCNKCGKRMRLIDHYIVKRGSIYCPTCSKFKAHCKMIAKDVVMAAIESESVLTGPMPDDLWKLCKTKQGATTVMRGAVMATKRGILNRIIDL